jgi:ABC-2 type transport system ATP-binding protein
MNHIKIKEYLKDIFKFDYAIVTHCNLNCVGCRMFAPINDKHFVKIEDYVKDIREIRRIFGDKFEVALFGGEPLLHPNITEIIMNTDGNLGISTNGLLLKTKYRDKNFMRALLLKHVGISYSNYVREMGSEMKHVENMYRSKGVPVFNMDNEYACNYFTENGVKAKTHFLLSRLNPQGTYDKCKQFLGCNSLFPIVFEGKIYPCTIPFVKSLQKFGFNHEPKEGIDYLVLKDVKDKREILDFCFNPIDFCRYCGSDFEDAPNEVVPWRKSKKERGEWL